MNEEKSLSLVGAMYLILVAIGLLIAASNANAGMVFLIAVAIATGVVSIGARKFREMGGVIKLNEDAKERIHVLSIILIFAFGFVSLFFPPRVFLPLWGSGLVFDLIYIGHYLRRNG